jgi:hypothetical protein
MDFSEQEEWDELLNAALENYVNALNELPLWTHKTKDWAFPSPVQPYTQWR